MERSLSQTFCNSSYCKPGEDIFEKNNLEYPDNISHDVSTLRKECMSKCTKVARDESKYQKLNVLRMNESA